MVNIYLGGFLGKKFGSNWKFDVQSPEEAIKALRANFPEFEPLLMENKKAFFKIIINGKPIKNLYQFKYRNSLIKEIKFIPIVAGSNMFDFLSIIVGVGLIALGAFLTASGFGSMFGIPLMLLGVAMLMNGIMGLLTPKPKLDKPQRETGSSVSNLFQGVDNMFNEGECLPVIYGENIVGGASINNGLFTSYDRSQVNQAIYRKTCG